MSVTGDTRTLPAPAAARVALPGQPTRWIIAPVVALAAFMEVLDISIANVSLQHIAGSLGASQDEATWVLTSYLVTNAIVLPITGWLSAVFGRKRFYLACILGFGISSFFCGLAPSLGLLILFRAIQGLTGGGLQPAAQAILADTFTPAQRGMAFAFYGIAVVFAPAIGPTLGGWITDNYSWHWIFLINVPISIGLYFLIDAMIEDPPHLVEERARLKEKGVKVEARLPEKVSAVTADLDRMIQVMLNLLSNAVKFCDSTNGRVEIALAERDGSLRVDVSDNGRGVSPEDHEAIFSKFHQAGDTLTDKPHGSGLGLHISRQIVEHFGGRMWVESTLGSGARFSFTLPIGALA